MLQGGDEPQKYRRRVTQSFPKLALVLDRILAFSRYLALEPLSSGDCAVLSSLALVLAILSRRFVEVPFRERQMGASRKSMFAFNSAGLLSVFGCGVLSIAMQGFPDRLSQELGFNDT